MNTSIGEISKILNFQNSSLKTCNMPTKYLQIWSLNGQLSLDRPYIREPVIIFLIQHFETDFLLKVSLKILNSRIILKSFTHIPVNLFSTNCEWSRQQILWYISRPYTWNIIICKSNFFYNVVWKCLNATRERSAYITCVHRSIQIFVVLRSCVLHRFNVLVR